MKRYFSVIILLCVSVLGLNGCRDVPSAQQPEEKESVQLIITEALTDCSAFDNDCFYARDAQWEFYRVYWEKLENLREYVVVTVIYNESITEIINKDIQTEYPPKYEMIAAEVKPAENIKYQNDAYIITLPLSKKSLNVGKEYGQYISYVTDELIAKAEKAILNEISRYSAELIISRRTKKDICV